MTPTVAGGSRSRACGCGPSRLSGLASAPSSPRKSAGIGRRLVLLLAVACGASVANLYYAQPLLHTLAVSFGVSKGTAGLLVTFSQIGYVLGLALLVPLGDLLERRGLITTTLLFTAAGQAAAADAPGFGVFAACIVVVGVTACMAQVIVPMSSTLAAEHERGSVVGTVMSGLLIGILLARTVSGVIAGAFGWRTVFVVAAVGMLLLAATLRRFLPRVPSLEQMRYRSLLASVLRLVMEEPVLRQRMVLGGLAFGCFSVLWTSLAFLLSGPPFHFGNTTIGLFGLAGVAGAAVAPVAGRLADRGHGRIAATGALASLLGSWGLLALGRDQVPLLLAGIVVLDLGTQGIHISNQSTIYAVRPEARSRLTTAYMVAYFLGGAVFSAITSVIYSSGGWSSVCLLGAATAGLALLVWLISDAAFRRGTVVRRSIAGQEH
jgi:predicted MFS family arabinose efflux permease